MKGSKSKWDQIYMMKDPFGHLGYEIPHNLNKMSSQRSGKSAVWIFDLHECRDGTCQVE